MKPFVYQAPISLHEAIALLSHPDVDAQPFAGGTDLLVQMRRGLSQPDMLVDVKKIPELSRIALDPAGGITLGAAVSCAELRENVDVQQHYPGLVDAISLIGGTAIQGRATVGGNLCNAAPSGDSIPALIVLNAMASIARPEGQSRIGFRTVPVAEFCTAPGKTALGKGEMLVSVRIPAPVLHSGAGYARFTPRREMDIAVAGAGAWLRLSEDCKSVTEARIAEARIALAAVAPIPLLVPEAGAALAGQLPGEEAFAHAAEIAMQAAQPISDVRGTAEQRRHLVGVLVKRALERALQRAQATSATTERRPAQ